MFYYGYVVALCSFLILLVTFGVNYSFGVFFNHLLADLGWSRAVTSAGYSLAQFVGGIIGVVTGRICDRVGPRIIVIVSVIFLALGCFLMSLVNQPWQLNIFFGLFIGIGFGGPSIPLSTTTSRWFFRRRGLMTGIVIAGIGTGIIVMPLIAEKLISVFDWRKSFTIIGILALAVVVPAALFLKRDPSKIGKSAYGENEIRSTGKAVIESGMTFKEAIRTGQFWIIGVICICFGFYVQGVMAHIVPHARSLGIEAGVAVFIISFLGIGSIGGRIVLGSLSDRIGVKNALIVALSLNLLAFLWLQVASTAWMLYLFAGIYGLGYGALISMLTLIPARIFGLISLGTMVGVITFIYTAGGAAGPIVTGYIYDVTGSYHLAFIIFAVLAVCALGLTLTLHPDVRKKDKQS